MRDIVFKVDNAAVRSNNYALALRRFGSVFRALLCGIYSTVTVISMALHLAARERKRVSPRLRHLRRPRAGNGRDGIPADSSAPVSTEHANNILSFVSVSFEAGKFPTGVGPEAGDLKPHLKMGLGSKLDSFNGDKVCLNVVARERASGTEERDEHRDEKNRDAHGSQS